MLRFLSFEDFLDLGCPSWVHMSWLGFDLQVYPERTGFGISTQPREILVSSNVFHIQILTLPDNPAMYNSPYTE
jgi:hypothetical protein